MKDTKMIKTARKLDLVTNIIQKILIAEILIVVALGIFITTVKGDFFANALMKVDMGHLTLILENMDIAITDIVMKYWFVAIFEVVVFLFLIFHGIQIIRFILKPMKEGKPFEISVSPNIRKLGWLLLVSGGLNIVLQFVEKMILLETYDFSKLFNMEMVKGFEFSNNIDITFLIFACVLFLLSYIFQYGEELQRESDETL